MSQNIERTTPSTPAAGDLSALPTPKALLFDLDGTLVRTVHLRVESWRRAFAEFGMEVSPDELGQYMGSDGRWLAGEVARTHGRELSWNERDRLDQRSGAVFSELNRHPEPLPGATELLTALEHSDRVTFAIATASQPGQVMTSVNALRLPNEPRITDASHVEHAKPEPDLLLETARQLGADPAACWYVGDSKWDMMASFRAGMAGIAITTGATSAGDLRDAGASVALPSLAPVLEELRRRGLID